MLDYCIQVGIIRITYIESNGVALIMLYVLLHTRKFTASSSTTCGLCYNTNVKSQKTFVYAEFAYNVKCSVETQTVPRILRHEKLLLVRNSKIFTLNSLNINITLGKLYSSRIVKQLWSVLDARGFYMQGFLLFKNI